MPKRFVRASRPAETEFPAWLEGEWAATGSFDGFVLPHKDRFDTRRLMSERSVPGFTKASLVWLADVGRSGVGYRLRFSRRRGDGAVIADSAFNLTSVLEAYLDAPGIPAAAYTGISWVAHAEAFLLGGILAAENLTPSR